MRPDDSKFVYAVKPGIWAGAVVALLTLIASPMLPLATADDRFIATITAFTVAALAIALFRIRRRTRDHSAYRSVRPRAWRRDDDWRFWALPAALVVVAFVIWLVDR